MVAGIPGASLITSAVLILGIIQIGPSIVLIPLIIWSWVVMETTIGLAVHGLHDSGQSTG